VFGCVSALKSEYVCRVVGRLEPSDRIANKMAYLREEEKSNYLLNFSQFHLADLDQANEPCTQLANILYIRNPLI
jgi:hypothetical protein